jgi:uncharacterized protein (DUF885 family)
MLGIRAVSIFLPPKPLTMKKILFFALVVIAAGCAQKEAVKTENKQEFSKMLDTYYEEYLKFNPFEATQTGDNRYNDLLPIDISTTYRSDLKAFYKRYADSVQAYDRAQLTPQEQLSYDILKRETTFRQELLEFPDHLFPVHQFWGLTLTMPQIGSGQSFQPFKTAKDYDDFLKRVDAFSVWVDTAIVNMRKGLAGGYTYPKILMERVLPQCKDLMVTDVTKSIFYQPITNMPDSVSADDKTRLTEAYKKAITEKIVPTYTRLHDFLKNEYIPKTRTTTGIGDITDGKTYYQLMVRLWTTTDMTPEEIFAIGESEVTRIKTEMEKVKTEVGFKGDLQAFFKYVNDDKKFKPYKSDQEVIDAYKAIEKKIEPTLKSLFNMTPKTGFEVRQTEEFREMSASAEYSVGSLDGTRPGIFYVPVIKPEDYNVSGMETLFLHEAIPGHHYQISLQQENQELPRFRKTLWYGAYGEGWALYAESLGKELGLYTDPIQYFGHLGDEMHRAIRLVVDVGMHTKGWTREQAIKYMIDNEPVSEQSAVAEIERYMAIPGQALSYKLGQLKIRGLRERAKSELGDKFNIGLFHDEVLKYGNLPLNVLEDNITKWIASQKGA